jgi:hypothetical protein
VIISPAPGLDNPKRFEGYLNITTRLLLKDKAGHKRLSLGECSRLRTALTNLSKEHITARREVDCPAASCLGYALMRLMNYEPWLVEVPNEKLTWTRREEHFAADYLKTADEIINEMFYSDEEPDDFDDGILRPTVKTEGLHESLF